ncbi:MAG: nickel-responsive transcriptional regulator NikR [Promethearchaeota archaeon]
MTKPGTARISISLPPDLLREFDSAIKQMGLDRSKAIQQAMRNFISEYRWEHSPTAFTVGTITLIYHHDVRGLESELTDIQHQYPDLITSSTHVHLDAVHCLLVIVVKGQAKAMQSLASKLKGLRGIKQLKLTGLAGSISAPTEHIH